MGRIHLFEVEDLAACPSWLRNAITEMISVVHRWFATADILAKEIEPILTKHPDAPVTLVDFCSGHGGPMPVVLQRLKQQPSEAGQGIGKPLRLVLTDLHPSASAVERYRNHSIAGIRYLESPIDATSFQHHEIDMIDENVDVVIRTMICSFHHLAPQQGLVFPYQQAHA